MADNETHWQAVSSTARRLNDLYTLRSSDRPTNVLRPMKIMPCAWCGFQRRGISARRCCVCQQCGTEQYCSRECRDLAWAGGHWIACGPASKMMPVPDSEQRCRIVEDAA